ncbi:hypothetical protein DE146DRAFT_622413 [Phaeosphaeria sp. MPI-PUGE-AT-0046c]|nr:hypothetical protein DE146DRAFT_622413 [Phaeosphaeria sp. MPI-PUGE-AT-0046c]
MVKYLAFPLEQTLTWYRDSQCAVLRFILFVPFGYYWSHSTTHRDVINDHAELYNGTYDPAIVIGERLAATWGTFAFYWNFAVWIPSFWFPPPINLPFAVIDTLATIYLSIATHRQTGYVPHTKRSCAFDAAYSWHRPPGANESFFEAAARLNATVSTPEKMCETFVEEWQYGITISFFYALVSFLNIVAFFGALCNGRQQGESFKDFLISLSKMSLKGFARVPKFFVLGLVIILWWIPQGLFRCLPISWTSKVRFGRRFALKTGLGLEQEAELAVTELKDIYKRSRGRRHQPYQGAAGAPSPLSNFLGIYDMLMAVTEELHYSDIMSLSLVSKSIREAVLPSDDLERRLRTFKTYTCKNNETKDCWVCSKQICTVWNTFPKH